MKIIEDVKFEAWFDELIDNHVDNVFGSGVIQSNCHPNLNGWEECIEFAKLNLQIQFPDIEGVEFKQIVKLDFPGEFNSEKLTFELLKNLKPDESRNVFVLYASCAQFLEVQDENCLSSQNKADFFASVLMLFNGDVESIYEKLSIT